MDFLQDPAFWWAVAASVWAVTSDYLGANPNIRSNGVTQLLVTMINGAITNQTKAAGRNRRRR